MRTLFGASMLMSALGQDSNEASAMLQMKKLGGEDLTDCSGADCKPEVSVQKTDLLEIGDDDTVECSGADCKPEVSVKTPEEGLLQGDDAVACSGADCKPDVKKTATLLQGDDTVACSGADCKPEVSVKTPEEGLLQGDDTVACSGADCKPKVSVQPATPLTQLLQATTQMLREGTTPAVLVFTNDTLDEIKKDIIPKIIANHKKDQEMLDAQLAELEAILATYNDELKTLAENNRVEELAHDAHVGCRGANKGAEPEGSEAALCLDASKKNWDRAEKWRKLIRGENEYIEISTVLHGRFCPTEGQETWHTKELTDADINDMVPALESYRKTTVTKMMKYNDLGAEYFRVLIPAWEVADETANKANKTHMAKRVTCDALKKTLETKSCTRAQHHAELIKVFEEEWHAAELILNKTKENVVLAEKDRVREFVTLHMVQCLLKKIESRNGTRCDEVGEAEQEIKDCETKDVVTIELEIDYPCSPEKPEHPPIKVYPGQPEEYWVFRYTQIESHGFCFTGKDGVVDRVNNQFPMPVIHNKDVCPLVDFVIH